MVDIVGPRWTEIKRQVPLELARKCRIQGKSHAEYKTMVNEELQRQIKHLIKQNRCAPFATIAVPLAVNIPLFVFISLVLRSALVCSGSPIGAETVPWWSPPSDLMAKFESSAKILQARGIEGEALRKLTIMEGPTLAEVDKTMFSPIGLGMLTLINVELGQWLRKPLFDAGDVKAPMEEKQMSVQQKETKNKRESLANFRSTVIGNTSRTASIAFVVIASQAPTGLALYWLTSAVYTLAQNSAFAFLDSRRRSYAC
jgi:inner membrane protein COX18